MYTAPAKMRPELSHLAKRDMVDVRLFVLLDAMKAHRLQKGGELPTTKLRILSDMFLLELANFLVVYAIEDVTALPPTKSTLEDLVT